MLAERVRQLECVANFRDFGSYETIKGGRVVEGRLFRSGHFAGATARDRGTLDALGIALVVDLRRTSERDKEPSAWPDPELVELIVSDDRGVDAAPGHLAFLKSADLTPGTVEAFVRASYRSLPYQNRNIRLFSRFLGGLDALDADRAALICCAHGKDRTGILAGVTLALLGVAEETVLEDFELSNRAVDPGRSLPAEHARLCRALDISPPMETLAPMVVVSPTYLAAAFDEMRAHDGSIDGYLDRLGADAAMRERLRAKYLA